MIKEEWKIIEGFNGLYSVSNLGSVKRKDSLISHNKGGMRKWKGRELLPNLKKGYKAVCIYDNGTRHEFTVHRLVAMAFINNPDNKPCVNHKDGNVLNNNVSNLEWVTYKENTRHAIDNKLLICHKGSTHYSTCLSESDVILIRQSYKNGESQSSIGAKYDMCQSAISRIVNNKNWKHL